MSFDFDEFINKPSIQIFGTNATITPAKSEFAPFEINGDFHEDYKEANPDLKDSVITSSVIAIFIRGVDLPDYYPKINQGDSIETNGKNYQIIDVQIHIPGSKKLVLHESSQINN